MSQHAAVEPLPREELRARVFGGLLGFVLLVGIPVAWHLHGADPTDEGRPAGCESTAVGPAECFR